MKRVNVLNATGEVIGWCDVREPAELTVAGRRRLLAAFTACGTALRRVQEATQFQLAMIELKEGQTEPTKEQKGEAVARADPQPPLSEDESDRLLQLEQAGIVATVIGWYLDAPISRATLEDMTPAVYDPIQVAIDDSVQAVLTQLQVKFEITPPQPVGVEPSPFGVSSDSDTSASEAPSLDPSSSLSASSPITTSSSSPSTSV